MDWRTALFEQAHSDYEILQLLSRENAAGTSYRRPGAHQRERRPEPGVSLAGTQHGDCTCQPPFPSLRFTGKSMLNMLKFLDRCFQII